MSDPQGYKEFGESDDSPNLKRLGVCHDYYEGRATYERELPKGWFGQTGMTPSSLEAINLESLADPMQFNVDLTEAKETDLQVRQYGNRFPKGEV